MKKEDFVTVNEGAKLIGRHASSVRRYAIDLLESNDPKLQMYAKKIETGKGKQGFEYQISKKYLIENYGKKGNDSSNDKSPDSSKLIKTLENTVALLQKQLDNANKQLDNANGEKNKLIENNKQTLERLGDAQKIINTQHLTIKEVLLLFPELQEVIDNKNIQIEDRQ